MSIPLFDCHCDTIYRCLNEGGSLRKNRFQLDLERLHAFSPSAQVFAVCSEKQTGAKEDAEIMLSLLRSELEASSDIVRLCLSHEDLARAADEGKIAALISIEGCEQIYSLDHAYRLGARILHITWNYDNELCGAAVIGGGGLTEKGRAFVKKAQSTGFALDMSHISERGFWDTLELADKPVIAGHSNSKALCDVPRNLTDEQYIALARMGGGAGINLYPEFLGLGRDLEAAAEHIEHFLELGGERAVFLGCDLDGIPCMPKGMTGIESIGELYNVLLRRNYPEKLTRDIFWNNLYEIMGRML